MQQENMTGIIETQSADRPWLLLLLRRHPLICYFVIAYAISWGVGFPLIVGLHVPVSFWLAIPVASSPTIASFIMTAATEGRAGVGTLLRRYVRWRVGLVWYLVALLALPALIVLVSLLQPGGAASVLQGLQSYPAIYVLTFFAGGPFLEEPGWRGFALPRLQRQLGPLPGSLLLGFLWGIWHLPLFFFPGYNGAGTGFVGISTTLLAFTVVTPFISTVFAWVSNNTRASLLLVMLLHASINSAGVFLPTTQASLSSQLPMYVAFVALSLLIIIATRGRLSYDRYIRQTDAQTDPLSSDPLA